MQLILFSVSQSDFVKIMIKSLTGFLKFMLNLFAVSEDASCSGIKLTLKTYFKIYFKNI